MQRINLGKPYDDYINHLIESGFYSTATEILRDALRDKMEKDSIINRKSNLIELLLEGEKDIELGNITKYSPDLLEKLHKQALVNKENKKLVKSEVRP
jgi:antitoxin ParD1/3/4